MRKQLVTERLGLAALTITFDFHANRFWIG
jgi:hypothetical protein